MNHAESGFEICNCTNILLDDAEVIYVNQTFASGRPGLRGGIRSMTESAWRPYPSQGKVDEA